MAQNYLIVQATGSDPADEWVKLGVSAHVANNLPDAQQKYQQALRLDPRHAIATLNLAIVFAQSALMNDALLTVERAELIDPKNQTIRMNRALIAMEAGRTDEAVAAARSAVEIAPDDVPCLLALAQAETADGHPDRSVPLYNKILDKEPMHPQAGPNACFIRTLTACSAQEMTDQRRRWHAANKYSGNGKFHAYRNDKDPNKTLRIGYVGGDFKRHSAAFIFSNVLLHHSQAVEMYLYSTLPVDPVADPVTKKYQDASVGRWRDISAMNDDDAAQLVINDRIDILVDLAAHTNGGRLALFTRKPAPVQVTAWGFAHGTGCPEIDYFLADPIVVPVDERQHYSEKVLDLPCIVTMEPPLDYNLKGTSLPPIRKNGYFTFGVYSRYEKMSDECLRAYAEILRLVPDSKIEFKDAAYHKPAACKRIIKAFEGIEHDRLLFSLATSHPEHMQAYQQADLILDPWPHVGGVVGMEQLWMSCPVLTLYGTHCGGRTTASVLTCMGRGSWVAKTVEEFIEKAATLANDGLKELADARKVLRAELLKSPVVVGYVDAVEAVYRECWKAWCNK